MLPLGGVGSKSLLEHNEERHQDTANWRKKECLALFSSICSLEAMGHINGPFLLLCFPGFCVACCLGAAATTWNWREKLQRTVIISGLAFEYCFYKRYRKSSLEKTSKHNYYLGICLWKATHRQRPSPRFYCITGKRGSRKCGNSQKISQRYFSSEVMKVANSAQSSYCLAFYLLLMLP